MLTKRTESSTDHIGREDGHAMVNCPLQDLSQQIVIYINYLSNVSVAYNQSLWTRHYHIYLKWTKVCKHPCKVLSSGVSHEGCCHCYNIQRHFTQLSTSKLMATVLMCLCTNTWLDKFGVAEWNGSSLYKVLTSTLLKTFGKN